MPAASESAPILKQAQVMDIRWPFLENWEASENLRVKRPSAFEIRRL
jgi:hypothetical protein